MEKPFSPLGGRTRGLLAIAAMLALGIILGAVPVTAFADGFRFGGGVDLVHFDYREFDRDDRELNAEDGFVPGIRFHTAGQLGATRVRIEASLHDGSVRYDGETQRGDPLGSRTETRFLGLSGRLGWRLAAIPGHWHGFVHAARREWRRDIQDSGDVQGLNERYRWSEIGAGLRYGPQSAATGRWQHAAAVTLFAVVDGSVRVALAELDGRDWDDITLDLGDAAGVRLRYRASRSLGGNRRLYIEPYAGYWEFDRSPTRTIRADGRATGARIAEPSSRSRRVGLHIGFSF